MKTKIWRAVLLLGVALVVAYELYAAFSPVSGDTISEITWAHTHPMFAFIAGVVAGHLFWQRRPSSTVATKTAAAIVERGDAVIEGYGRGLAEGRAEVERLRAEQTCIDIWLRRREPVTHESATLRSVQEYVERAEAELKAVVVYWSDIEARSADAHEVYQREAHRTGDVRHPDAYADLSETAKNYDRVLIRWVCEATIAAAKEKP